MSLTHYFQMPRDLFEKLKRDALKLQREPSGDHIAEYLERVRPYYDTPAFKKAMRKRSAWVEPRCMRGPRGGRGPATGCPATAAR